MNQIKRSGLRCGKAKLTPEAVADIRRKEKSGLEYARQYGIHSSHVSRLQSGQRRVYEHILYPATPALRARTSP